MPAAPIHPGAASAISWLLGHSKDLGRKMTKHASKIAILAMAAGLVIAVYGCGGSSGGGGNSGPGSGGGATPTNVSIPAVNNASAPMGYSFNSPISVKSGDTVTWVNQSTAPHGITWDSQTPSTSPAPGANIPVFSAGTSSATWTVPTVTTATTYNYHCTVHGPTMPGVINVTP